MAEDVIEAMALLPFPFCGIAEPRLAPHRSGGFYIECRDCPAAMEEDDADLSVAAWNTRPQAAYAVVSQRIEVLEAALARIARMNDLSEASDDGVEAAARNGLYECELIARAALTGEK